MGGSKIIDDDGLRICRNLLNDDRIATDPRLRLCILTRLAHFLLLQHQFSQAINYLEQALVLADGPEKTVVLLMLADACEFGKSRDKAIQAYGSIVESNKDSLEIGKYVELQFERIQSYGLKKPMQLGLKYMSY